MAVISDPNSNESNEQIKDWGFTENELNSCMNVIRQLATMPESALDDISKKFKGFKWMFNKERLFGKTKPKRANQPNQLHSYKVKQLETELKDTRCYTCNEQYSKGHFFYVGLCYNCGLLNWSKRNQMFNVNDRTILVTGARSAIGKQVCLSLLRNGATIIATTRYPNNMISTYSAIDDYNEWKDRLHIYKLDLRNLRLVEQFCFYLNRRYTHLYAIINNANHTVRHNPNYYKYMSLNEIGSDMTTHECLEWNMISRQHTNNFIKNTIEGHSPKHKKLKTGSDISSPELNNQLQLNSLTENETWFMDLEDISGEEAAEIHAVNALAPFIFNSKLKGILLNLLPGETEETRRRYIINVSSRDGKFFEREKTNKHPHANMAKASLNMMTRTSASGYAIDNIFMNSVDIGLDLDEYFQNNRTSKKCPFDEYDAAARILDCIYTQSQEYGYFCKDYNYSEW